MTEEGIDEDGDGLYEEQRFYNPRWPNPRQPMQVERDDDRDGQFEQHQEFRPDGTLERVQIDDDGDGRRDTIRYHDASGLRVVKEGRDRDGDGNYEEWRFPEGSAQRVGFDDDDDRDIDRWQPPGPPVGWCAARCRVSEQRLSGPRSPSSTP
jgi:hypothetical protein